METFDDPRNETVTVGDWLITYLITMIPLVGFIMLFVWAFSSSTLRSKANWAKAVLILMAIGIVLGIILVVVFGATFLGLADSDFMDQQY